MFGSLGNIKDLLKTARDLQGNLAKMQEQLAAKRYDAVAGGDMVRATVDGRCQLLEVKIDPRAVSDVELLEDLVKAAINAATAKAQEGMKEEMSTLTGGVDIGGLGRMLGGS